MHPVVTSPGRSPVGAGLSAVLLQLAEHQRRCSEVPPALPRKRNRMEQRTCSHHEGNDRAHPEGRTHLALSQLQEVRLERAV